MYILSGGRKKGNLILSTVHDIFAEIAASAVLLL
jgi:hypothetical protein